MKQSQLSLFMAALLAMLGVVYMLDGLVWVLHTITGLSSNYFDSVGINYAGSLLRHAVDFIFGLLLLTRCLTLANYLVLNDKPRKAVYKSLAMRDFWFELFPTLAIALISIILFVNGSAILVHQLGQLLLFDLPSAGDNSLGLYSTFSVVELSSSIVQMFVASVLLLGRRRIVEIWQRKWPAAEKRIG
jgi:hypothetical protein